MAGAVGGASGAGATSSARGVAGASSPKVDSATLTADDGGNLTLSPTANQPINVKGAKDGRYHVDVGGQDIAFTPDQMKRLNIKAGPNNPVTAEAGLDVGFKVNGKPAGKAAPKGYDALPQTAGDKYEAGSAGAAPRTGSAAAKANANHAVQGNNWDSVGVPGQSKGGGKKTAAEEAVKADKAQHKDAAHKADDAKEAKEPKEAKDPDEEEKKAKKKKKGHKVDTEHVVTPGESKVEVKEVPEGTMISFQESMELWKKIFQNMLPRAEGGLQ